MWPQKQQEPFQPALGTNRRLTNPAKTARTSVALLLLNPHPFFSRYPCTERAAFQQVMMVWLSSETLHAEYPAVLQQKQPMTLPNLKEASCDALQLQLSNPGTTRHGLPFSCNPTGTFLEPHIYLMLMPRCLDIHNVLSWESN